MSRLEFARRVNALAQFRVDDVTAPTLSTENLHHLFKVLRAKPDEELVVTNGAGSWAFARVINGDVERVSDVGFDEPDDPVTLYLSPLKGDRDEWAVAKATELGVDVIVPLLAQRVVVKWTGERRARALARWRRIAADATGQCRRSYDVLVAEPCLIQDVPADVGVAQFEGTGEIATLRALAIGPEGGWAPEEWDARRIRIGLGETVLRAETAALAAGTLLVSARAGWSRRHEGSKNGS